MKRGLSLIIQAIIVIYVVIFAVINTQKTPIRFFFGGSSAYEMPLYIIAIAALIIGLLIGIIMMSLGTFSLRLKIKKLRKQAMEFEKEVTRLKNITITGSELNKTAIDEKTSDKKENVNSDIKNILR